METINLLKRTHEEVTIENSSKKCKMNDTRVIDDMHDDENNNVVGDNVITNDSGIVILLDTLNNLCKEESELILTKKYGMEIIKAADYNIVPTVFSLNYLRLIGSVEMFEYLRVVHKSDSVAFQLYKDRVLKYKELSAGALSSAYASILLINVYNSYSGDDSNPLKATEEDRRKYAGLIMSGLSVNRLW